MTHSHCPLGCDRPQPITADENPKLPPGAIPGHQYCGRCWVQDGHLSEMVPCTTELCADFIDFATVRVYSPEEHSVLDAQFIAVEGGIGVQVNEPNNGHVFPDYEEDDLTCEQCDVRWLDRYLSPCSQQKAHNT